MYKNYFLIMVAIALACLGLIFFSVGKENEALASNEVLPPSSKTTYQTYITGNGIVEPSSESIFISSPMNRLILTIPVTVGQKVKKGEVLFTLDNRDLKAEHLIQLTNYQNAQAKLARLTQVPRPEDLAIAEANLKTAQAESLFAKEQYDRVMGLPDMRAISQEEKSKRFLNYQQAEAKLQQVQAECNKIKQGTWLPDLKIAELEVQMAHANLLRIENEMERTNIHAPLDGTILQIKAHEGEMALAEGSRKPLMIMGNIEELNLRVTVNQLDSALFNSHLAAQAFLQGNNKVSFPLEFLRTEPLLVNKDNITNEITEVIDTRVLPVIYRLKNSDQQLWVGQQLDVFIEVPAKKAS